VSTLSPRTEQLIEHVFSLEAREPVRELLEGGCGAEALGCTGWSAEEMERIWFAVLKLGERSLPALEAAVGLARTDWRDLLMAAGFGEDTEAHHRWWARVC
jgi:hypothetical protein